MPSLSLHATRLALALLLMAASAQAQEAPLQWQPGPGRFALGPDLAEVEVPEGYLFLDASETRRLMEMMENPITNTEVGTLAPASEAESWFLVFEYDPIGYVKDGEADSLDPAAILASIRTGTEAANKERLRRGWSPMDIVGWNEEPHYDPVTHNLSWAIIGNSEHGTTINKIVKVLGRRGVMTATLVSSPDELPGASPSVDTLMAGFAYRPGNTYAEFVAGTDNVAKLGLAALVVGGAGAALAQSGLLARFWKALVAGLVGVAAALKRMFGTQRAEDEPISRA